MTWKEVGQKILSVLGPASSLAAPFLGPAGALLPPAIKAIAAVLGIPEDKATPDAVMAAIQANPAAAAELAKAQMQYEHELAMRQIETEEKSRSEQAAITLQDSKDLRFWNSGWRPGIGWTCAASLFVYYVPRTLVGTVLWVVSVAHNNWQMVPYPDVFDIGELLGLVGTLLGVGGLKSWEKIKHVSK